MNVIYSLIICLFFLFPLSADEIKTLYQKNIALPASHYEEQLIKHVKDSFEKASRLESKLTGQQFEEVQASKKWRKNFIPLYHSLSGITQYAGYHLLNNLCSLQGASHLHVGLLAGDSFISALYGNQSTLKQQTGIDWFKECPEEIFYSNCNRYLILNKCQFINSECFKVDKSSFENPIDIYFYDADHSLIGHEKALTYFNDIFADVFVVVIDDWSCPWIRGPTFKAFNKLGYSILYENAFLNSNDHDDHGQYVAVVRKSGHIIEENLDSRELLQNLEFNILKNQLFKSLSNSWCTKEKANLIMETIFRIQPKVCVEVGTFTGSTFLPIVSVLSLLKQGHAYAVDAWSNVEAVKGIPQQDPHYKWWSTVDFETVYESFLNTIADKSLTPYYTTICASSSDAVSQFDKIDFLHLDGNFSEEGSLNDVMLYLPKVSSGRYILLSNVFFSINKQYTKMKALGALLEQCEIIAETDNSQTVLFRKL